MPLELKLEENDSSGAVILCEYHDIRNALRTFASQKALSR